MVRSLLMENVFELVNDDSSLEIEGTQYLTFSVAEETYGIELLKIREILEYEPITSIPLMPMYLAGVLNLRGKVVPVINLHQLFNEQPIQLGKKTCIIIVDVALSEDNGRRNTMEIGVLVDMVFRVINLPKHQIEPPPELGSRIRADFIEGMGNLEGRFIVLLDTNRVLSTEALVMVDNLSNGIRE